MIPQKFEYKRASTVNEAIHLLSSTEDAKVLSGGHSLIPALKLRLNDPAMLVDISALSELNYIREENDHICLGANTTHGDIEHSDLIKHKYPALSATAAKIGDPQVRNKGTIGGSIAHADPSADWPAVLLAHDAQIVCESANGTRSLSASDFFLGFYMTALDDGEIIREILIPDDGRRSVYLKFEQPASRFALVGCALSAQILNGTASQVRVAFSGVADGPFRDHAAEKALEGQELNASSADAATANAIEGVSVMSDHFASEDYRTHLAKVFLKRAVLALAES